MNVSYFGRSIEYLEICLEHKFSTPFFQHLCKLKSKEREILLLFYVWGKLIQKLLLNLKCMGYFVRAYYSISSTSFVEVPVLNHYALVRKILGKQSKLQDEDAQNKSNIQRNINSTQERIAGSGSFATSIWIDSSVSHFPICANLLRKYRCTIGGEPNVVMMAIVEYQRPNLWIILLEANIKHAHGRSVLTDSKIHIKMEMASTCSSRIKFIATCSYSRLNDFTTSRKNDLKLPQL
ncbi:hypothetical protein Tco_0017383 [Tanacetum coccineum]